MLGEAFSLDGNERFARAGAMFTDAVARWTALMLLRFRYRLVEPPHAETRRAFMISGRGPQWLARASDRFGVVAKCCAKMLLARGAYILQSDPKLGRAEALRRAMLAYMKDATDPLNAYPALWAPFVVVGKGAAR